MAQKRSHCWKGVHLKAQEDVCCRPLSICHPCQAKLTLQKQLPLVAVAIPHLFKNARGNNESLLQCQLPLHQFRVPVIRDFWSAASPVTSLSWSICCQTVDSDDFFLCCFGCNPLVPAWEALYMIRKNNLLSLMEWLRLTSCCNKGTLKWLETYYHSSSGCSLAPCSVIAVRLIRKPA